MGGPFVRREESSMMMIQSWIIAGLIVGALAGLLLGKGYSVVGDVLSGMLRGLVGGCSLGWQRRQAPSEYILSRLWQVSDHACSDKQET
jgi:uncharacterized membrane protein YeaQ/YmgE (transglycosylase-associated protein family)